MVYDITNRKTFEALKNWLKDILDFGPENINIIVVGNKLDKSYERDVSFMEAIDFCRNNKLDYVEVSALSGTNVNDIFEKLSKNLAKKKEVEKPNKSNISSRMRLGMTVNSSKMKEEFDESFDYPMYENYKKKKGKCC